MVGGPTFGIAAEKFDPKKLIEVKRIYKFQNKSGGTGTLIFKPNGTFSVWITSGFRDNGKWRTEGQFVLCQKWRKRLDGKENCYNVADHGNGKIQLVNVKGGKGGAILTPAK